MEYDDRLVRHAFTFADQIRTVETALTLSRRPSITYDPSPSGLLHLHIPMSTCPIKNYVVSDAIVNCRFRIAHKEAFAIWDTLYGISEGEILQTRPYQPTYVAELKDKIAIYAFIWTATNFYHWLMQILTAIESVLSYRDQKDVVIVTSESLSHWQEDSLRLLGFGDLERFTMEPNRYYQIPSLEISEFCIRPTILSRTGLQVCKRLKSAVVVEASKGTKIYVSRQDATFRRVINESDLIELLVSFGFEILLLGSMRLSEQIQAFHDAAIVIGPHGQGMCHVAYCNEGTFVWELFPEKFVTESTIGISSVCGLNYHASAFAQELTDRSSQVTDYEIDLDVIEKKLQSIGLSRL